jgi:hypothetical protein
MRTIYRVPLPGTRFEAFQVVKWVKREAILLDAKGRTRRLTPSEFEFYEPDPHKAVSRALKSVSRQIEYTRERLDKLASDVMTLSALLSSLEQKGGRA